jgi:hypothetical protein
MALPVLTAYLRHRGVEVIQRDLNVEFFDEALSRRFLRQSVEKVRTRFGPAASKRPTPYGRPPDQKIQWALSRGLRLADQVESAKNVLRSGQFYDPEVSLQAYEQVVQSLELASLAYFPCQIELTRFAAAGEVDRSKSLAKLVRDPQLNPFIEFFNRGILQDIRREKPDLVGISIPTMDQMLAGMTLAALIKESGTSCHITVGGPHISMLRESLPTANQVFQWIDSAVIFEGEIPLLELVRAIENGASLSEVPSLIYRETQLGNNQEMVIRTTDLAGATLRPALEGLTPDFNGLPLSKYLVPEPVLPLATSHGCYHGKCGFCNVGYGHPERFFPLPIEMVVKQMLEVREKYGARHIFFTDEAIPPRTLRLLSLRLEELGAPINWCGCMRFEKTLTAPLLEQAKRGGCRMLLYGLETASEPMIEHMVKGVYKSEMSRVLRESTAAGIWNHTFFFFGFPGETLENAQDTINFIYEHQDVIHSASPGTFLLERFSPVHLMPEKFGVSKIIEDRDRDLAIYYDYELEKGLDEKAAQQVVDVLLNALPGKRYGQYYVHDVPRFLYTSFLSEQGVSNPAWIANG